ncbi:MAG: TonB family protein [Candidatus Acidiferrales bacterium]
MSNAAIFAGTATSPEGRRAKVRQPLGSLAYLDIIPDNGGIILNLSEDGLAFQAVGPLHEQKQVQLVVQLPHSGTRFETAAEIVWLGSTNREAGVRFLNIPADARLQIREWVESQNAPHADGPASIDLTSAQAERENEADSPLLHEGTDSDSGRRKWLSLMSEFEEKFEQKKEEPLLDGPEQKPANVLEPVSPALSDAPTISPKPEILPWPSAQRSWHEPIPPAPVPSHEISDTRSTAGESRLERPRLRQAELQEASGDSEYVTSSASIKREAPTQQASSTERASATKVHSGVSALESDFTRLRAVVVQGRPQAKSEGRKPEVPSRKRDSLRNQVALVVVFALFSVLCFGIGTWVGHLPSSDANQEDIANVSTPAQSSAPAPAMVVRGKSPTDGTSGAKGDAERNSASERSPASEGTRLRRGAISTVPPVTQSEMQPAAIPPAQGSAPGLSAAASTLLSSSDQHVDASAQSNGAAQLSPVDLSPQDSTPQVVDGYVLRPSDRFNPCHLMYRVDPVYPTQAQQQGIEGSVKVHLVIGADGSVQNEKLISGPAQLASAALDATKYWRYLPALLNGQPVPTEKDVEIAFHLPSH